MGNPYPFIDAILPSAAEMHEEAVLAHYERRLAEDAATIADLRARLRIMARVVCDGCGCEARCGDRALCWDCNTARLSCVLDGWSQDSSHAAACVSVGLRALCGRRILEGC